MSRAFVRESDVPQIPELPPLVSPLPPGAKNYLTAAGARRLRAEQVSRHRRHAVTQTIVHGDRPAAAATPDIRERDE